MRIAVQGSDSRWVIDNIVDDYRKYTRHQIVSVNDSPDIFWCVDTFSLEKSIRLIPSSCKTYVQVHHINEAQISDYNFSVLNKAFACIVPNKITEQTIKKYLNIPVHRIPYWVLSSVLQKGNEESINALRKEINFDNKLLIGSFVKDGNGKTGETPKIAKNPEMLVDVLFRLNNHFKGNIGAVLGGYSRKYVVKELERLKIPFVYLERYKDLNSLYDILDFYVSTSRYEGGPQAVLEASYRKVKILSTPVGLAPEILHVNCLCENALNFVESIIRNIDEREYNYCSVQKYLPDKIVPLFDNLFEKE